MTEFRQFALWLMQKFTIAFVAVMSLASFGCKKKGGMADSMAKHAGFKDAMCKCDKDKACAEKVAAEMDKYNTEQMKNTSAEDAKKMLADMSPEDMKAMGDVAAETEKCKATAMGAAAAAGGDKPAGDKPAGDKPADPPAAAGANADIPSECNDYKAAMEKLAACDKMPQASKDALKQGYDAMSQGWAAAKDMPAEAKKAMADGCKQGADALMQSGKALCGW